MKMIRRGIPVLALLTAIGGVPWGRAQNPGSAAPAASQESPAADPEVVTVQIVNRIPPVDRGNLKGYWTGVEDRTRDHWLQILPPQAKPPASVAGEVKLLGWVHTDGRVTGLATEESSGNGALDRAARAAVTGSVPYNSFPYGISVNQVRVRFTFTYNDGSGGTPATGKTPGLAGVKRKPQQ